MYEISTVWIGIGIADEFKSSSNKGGRMHNRITPRFLTEEMAREAIKTVLRDASTGKIRGLEALSRISQLCVVIYVPKKIESAGLNISWTPIALEPHVLCEYVIGRGPRTQTLKETAHSKACQRWQGLTDENGKPIPHLLFPGDTSFRGSAMRDGMVGACSGATEEEDSQLPEEILTRLIEASVQTFEAWRASLPREETRFIPR